MTSAVKSFGRAGIPTLHRVLIVTIMAIGLFLAPDPRLGAETESRNLAGFELAMRLQPLASDDPYSGPLGLSLFYERHRLPGMLYLGGQVAYWGFYPLQEDFGRSSMFLGEVRLGYDFTFRVERRFALTVSPWLGGGWYWRRFVYVDEENIASRPVLGMGVAVDLSVGRRVLLGATVDLTLLFDNQVRGTAGVGERLGVRF
jgi:hypothetical protein